MPDETVGRAEDVRRAPVVVLELHHARGRVVAFELEDVADARTAPSVDRLVGIAGHREIRVIDRQSPEDRILGGIRVLVLVDEDPAVTGVELAAEFGVVEDQPRHVDEQVIEVDGIAFEHHLLIDRPQPDGDLVGRPAPACFEGFRSEEVVLGAADDPCETVDRSVGEVQTESLRRPLHHRPGVVGVENRIVTGQPDHPGVGTEQPGRETVERPHFDRLRADERRHPAAHLVGGFVGERQGHDGVGRHPLQDEVGDPVGDDTRLAAARPRKHQERAVHVGGCPTLGCIEAVELHAVVLPATGWVNPGRLRGLGRSASIPAGW